MLEQNSMLQNLFNWFIALGFSIDMFVHPFGSRIWMLWCGTRSGQESIYHASDSWILSISLRLLHDDLIHFVSYFDWSKFPSWIEYGASSFLLFPHLPIYFWLDRVFPSHHIRDSNFLTWESFKGMLLEMWGLLWSKQSIFLPTFLQLMSALTLLFASTRAGEKRNFLNTQDTIISYTRALQVESLRLYTRCFLWVTWRP